VHCVRHTSNAIHCVHLPSLLGINWEHAHSHRYFEDYQGAPQLKQLPFIVKLHDRALSVSFKNLQHSPFNLIRFNLTVFYFEIVDYYATKSLIHLEKIIILKNNKHN
jgi:hypothetical protein